MSIPEFNDIIEPNDQTEARREHLDKLREIVGNVYPNKFDRSRISGDEDTISNLLKFEAVAKIVDEIKAHIATLAEGEKPDQELKATLNEKLKELGDARISGRLTTTPRTMGKAAFVHLSDGVNRLQIYVRRDDVKGLANGSEKREVNGWELFKLLDGGDFIGVSGFLFLTNTGELSIHVETLQFLSKALLPLPDKMHGIADPELRRRYRYADLIADSLKVEHEAGELTTREVFERRAKLISGMRRFLDDAGYIEVETPMLTPKATGAAATPFETYHNALDIPLYARIAPELYLKRLTVGGFEKVYELNRNFRNEGLSHKHNPEFTMLEFYCAYMDVNGMMDFAEAMLKESVQKATGGSLQVKIDNYIFTPTLIDFSKFERLSMKESVKRFWDSKGQKLEQSGLDISWFDDVEKLKRLVLFLLLIDKHLKNFGGAELDVSTILNYENVNEVDFEDEQKVKIVIELIGYQTNYWNETKNLSAEYNINPNNVLAEFDQPTRKILLKLFSSNSSEEIQKAKIIQFLFEELVEKKLIQPTFIVDYPKSISPLSKASPENPQIAERFELFINGMECANGFSELNDPQEQYERFVDQMKEREGGDVEAMVLDEDYIRALSYGMPPAAGIGIGIDRLVMLLTNKHSIRDVILFPHMRPIVKEEEKETKDEPVNPS